MRADDKGAGSLPRRQHVSEIFVCRHPKDVPPKQSMCSVSIPNRLHGPNIFLPKPRCRNLPETSHSNKKCKTNGHARTVGLIVEARPSYTLIAQVHEKTCLVEFIAQLSTPPTTLFSKVSASFPEYLRFGAIGWHRWQPESEEGNNLNTVWQDVGKSIMDHWLD